MNLWKEHYTQNRCDRNSTSFFVAMETDKHPYPHCPVLTAGLSEVDKSEAKHSYHIQS